MSTLRKFFTVLFMSMTLYAPSVYAEDADTKDETEESEESELKCDSEVPFVLNEAISTKLTEPIFEKVIPCLRAGKPQEIIINSGGDEAWTAFSLFDALRTADTQGVLKTGVYGHGHSAAVIIFLAGTTRQISCHSSMLIHEIRSRTLEWTTSEDSRENADRTDMTKLQYVDILSLTTGTITPAEAQAMMEAEEFLYAAELLSYNIATEIIGPGCE